MKVQEINTPKGKRYVLLDDQFKPIGVVNKYVVDLLLDYINEDALEYESDFVFINLYGRNKGFPMKYGSAEKLFERLSNDAGFEVTPHMLRHGFSQEKLESGWTLEQVQAYLRHKNVTSTEIYAQYTDVMKIEKMNLSWLLPSSPRPQTACSPTIRKSDSAPSTQI